MIAEQRSKTPLNISLWIVQILLAATFGWAAFMKLFQSADELAQMWPWTAENIVLVKLTGVVDLLLGIGLIAPGLLRIQAKLTVYAAFGIILLMIAATVFHIARRETSEIGINIVIMGVAIFIMWGRSKK